MFHQFPSLSIPFGHSAGSSGLTTWFDSKVPSASTIRADTREVISERKEVFRESRSWNGNRWQIARNHRQDCQLSALERPWAYLCSHVRPTPMLYYYYYYYHYLLLLLLLLPATATATATATTTTTTTTTCYYYYYYCYYYYYYYLLLLPATATATTATTTTTTTLRVVLLRTCVEEYHTIFIDIGFQALEMNDGPTSLNVYIYIYHQFQKMCTSRIYPVYWFIFTSI